MSLGGGDASSIIYGKAYTLDYTVVNNHNSEIVNYKIEVTFICTITSASMEAGTGLPANVDYVLNTVMVLTLPKYNTAPTDCGT